VLESKLEERLANSTTDFNKKALSEIKDHDYKIPVTKSTHKTVRVKKSQISNSLKTITSSKNTKLIDDVKSHFDSLEQYIPFCSSPKSFQSAWALRSEILTRDAANRLVNEGAQMVPVNKKSRIFKTDEQGPELGPQKRLVLGVRHSKGNYDDNLDSIGSFVYQPPNNTTGMLRFRWCQYLEQNLQIPFVLIAIMWFEYRINKNLNQVFVIAPAKITNPEIDLKNLGESLHHPLKLQIIERDEAYDAIRLFRSLTGSNMDTEIRKQLDPKLAEEWMYTQIEKQSKGNKIKTWAKIIDKSCPGTLCQHDKFQNLRNSDIAFGHIVSQNWASTFPHNLSSVHHPDNLYLTCKRCNSQLLDNFPDNNLRREILERGTIGDWLREFESAIRDS